MPGMRTRMLTAIGILLLVPISPSAAQEKQWSPSVLDRQERTENSSPENESEPEREEPRSPFEDHIETDRDAFTPSTRNTPINRWIMESSYSFIDNRGVPNTNSFPELLVRYGLFRRVELRLGWNYEVGAGGSVVTGESGEAVEGVDTSRRTREQRMLYGLKASLTEQRSWLPSSIAILQGYTPTGGDATATQLVATYAFGWRLPNRWRFDSAMRFATDSDNGNRFQVWAPSTVLRVPLGERFQVHAEYFGLFSQNRPSNFGQNYFSPGMHYLITPNLEVGLRLGWGLNEQAAAFFTNVGFGWRF
jgi:outer membrane putative beta-barrel porin/alpha-amylase